VKRAANRSLAADEAARETAGGTNDSTPAAFRNRRAFLMFALAIGAIPPERAVERIVAELEHKAAQ
jgi:hypothetical protein